MFHLPGAGFIYKIVEIIRDHHHIHFNVCFPCLYRFDCFFTKDFQRFLTLARSFLTFLSFKSPLITAFHSMSFPGRPLGKPPLTSKVLHVLDQALSSIFVDEQTIVVLYPADVPLCLILVWP